MFRAFLSKAAPFLKKSLSLTGRSANTAPNPQCDDEGDKVKLDEVEMDEANTRYECYFDREEIDGWEVRSTMNEILGSDMIAHPKVIIAALHACRRIDDYALTTRFLEGCKGQCGPQVKKIYPWLIQQIQPTLDSLGISTPEEMGYHEPQLALQKVQDVDIRILEAEREKWKSRCLTKEAKQAMARHQTELEKKKKC